MRVLLITSEYPSPAQPTRGIYNHLVARELVRNHEVVAVVPLSWRYEWQLRRSGESIARRSILDGVKVHYPRFWYTPGMLRGAYAWFLWQSVRATLSAVTADFKPDIVMSYWLHPDGAVAVRLGEKLRIPSVVMSGGSDILLLAQDQHRRRVLADVIDHATAAVFVGQHLANKANEISSGRTPTFVVRRGVDLDRFSPGGRLDARRRLGLEPEGGILVWVGRLAPVKGLDTLVTAMGLLKAQSRNVRLYLVGDGPLRQTLTRQIADTDVAGVVSMIGTVRHDQLPDWYRAADVCVLPSLSEGVPNVLQEAIACGARFVASRVGGIPEIADETLDRLVPAGDPVQLGDAIANALDADPQTPRKLLPSSWADSARQLEGVFAAAMARYHGETRTN